MANFIKVLVAVKKSLRTTGVNKQSNRLLKNQIWPITEYITSYYGNKIKNKPRIKQSNF